MSDSPSIRAGHLQHLIEPPLSEWPSIVAENNRRMTASHCVVAGQPLHRLRALARREALELAQAFTVRAELPAVPSCHSTVESPWIVTGHQPIIFGTGVWSKYHALSRFAEATSGIGIDLIIDSDRAAPIAIDIPSLGERPGIESIVLSPARPEECFAKTPVPTQAEVESFGEEVLEVLRALPNLEAASNFEEFLSALMDSLPLANNIAELMSFARRQFETAAGLNYLQLPVIELSSTLAFRSFAADILARADDFADVYNQELQVFRGNHKLRSAAQPVPDLRRDETAVELPFWLLESGVRRRAFVRTSAGAIEIFTHEGDAHVMSANADELQHQLVHVDLAPKALTLTMFARLFLADIFVHGTGGARYDSVTDEIIRRFHGLYPPHFAVVSVSATSPFAIDDSGLSGRISAAQDRLKMLKHHPERALSPGLSDPDRAPGGDVMELVNQKRRMISEISKPGADKAFLGEGIRHVNELLAVSLHDEVAAVENELIALRSRAAQAAVLSDRRYSYCFFDPREYSQLFGRTVL